MCYEIGMALQFLHENGVVHGDIKPENILMFREKSSNIVTPKLADFGYALLDGENAPVLPLGTFPWAAPEIGHRNVSGDNLLFADIYSFGLLVWYISKDGINPFESSDVCPLPLDSDEARDEIGRVKRSNSIRLLALKSLPSEKEAYKELFLFTLDLEPSARNLENAILHLTSRSPASGDISTNRAENLSGRTKSIDVSELIDIIWERNNSNGHALYSA